MQVDDLALLSDSLRKYQETGPDDQSEARLAIALTRVVENSIRPSLMKRLRPHDVDDVCSDIILGFWKFRHSVRPDEVGKLVQTLKHRRSTDQIRSYYRDADHLAKAKSADEAQFLAMLPSRDLAPGAQAGQDVWEMLYGLKLSAQDHLVAYTLYLGVDKQVIGKLLGMSASAVTRSLQRCRDAMSGRDSEDDQRKINA